MNKTNLIADLERLKEEYDKKSALLDVMLQTKEGTLSHDGISCLEKMKEYESTIKSVKEENQIYIKDINFLKDIIRRLNDQLNRYCERDGPLHDGLESIRCQDKAIDRQSILKLHSLLLAYDEIINEQNLTFGRMKKQYEDAVEKMRVLQKENENAFKYIEMIESEPVADGQIKVVMADTRLLMEERELFIKEINLLQQRKHQLELEHEKKVQKLECLLNGAKSKESTMKHELDQQNEIILALQKESNYLKLELKKSVNEEEHKKAVLQCSRLLEKLKKVHKDEALSMKNRVQQIKSEQEQLVEKLSDSSQQYKVAKRETFGYKTNLRKNHSKLQQQADAIKNLRKHHKVLLNRIRSLSQILGQLIQDRKSVLQMMQKHKNEAEKYSAAAKLRCAEIGKLTLKIKEDSFRWSQKFAETEGRRQAAEEAWQHSLKDSIRLRKLLQQKEEDMKQYLSGFYKKPNL